jgi:hypothetical protein
MRVPPVLLTVLVLAVGAGCGGGPPARTGPPVVALRPEVHAAAVLSEWDQRRAEAWAAGSPARLRGLYAPGSSTARADLRMLRAWRSRGLAVAGLTTQLLAVEVLSGSADRLRLRVTDRVVRATATGRGVRLPLPRDQPSAYLVVMVRRHGDWLVAETRNG